MIFPPTCASAAKEPRSKQDGLPTAAQETQQRLADALHPDGEPVLSERIGDPGAQGIGGSVGSVCADQSDRISQLRICCHSRPLRSPCTRALGS